MFGIDMQVLAIALLCAISAAAVSYGVLFSRIQNEKKAEDRIAWVKTAEFSNSKGKVARDRVQEIARKRKALEEDLKALEKQQHEKTRNKLSVRSRLTQAGLKITVTQFNLISAAVGILVLVFAFLSGAQLLIAVGIAFATALGLPRWVLNFLVKRRKNKFLNELPNALDVMVRSIKSGLPLNDAIRLIANEGQEPLKSEFVKLVEAQSFGLSIPEACARLYQSLPLPELNFFSIVITIQSQAGGNLSEALGNLSNVLRERRKMKQKIAAYSMEAKASAIIIGALPFIVTLLVYLTTPDYIMILFTDPRGHMILGASLVWMSIGVYIMRNMINFDI